MKKILIIGLALTLIGCKDNNFKVNKKKETNLEITSRNQKELTCEDIIYKIVKSSNLKFEKKNVFLTSIDRIEDDNIIIHVFFENNLSDNPKEKQIVESTIAWLSLNPNKLKLYNTTADPDNPIELNFDKNILNENDIFSTCQIFKKEIKIVSNALLKYTKLPIDFDEYYKACVYPYDSLACSNNYPKYSFNENDQIAKVFGKKYNPNNYMYLPKLNNYQPMILCNTDTDIESYDLVVSNGSEIISSLEIGLIDGESIIQFAITKDYVINLYKRKNSTEKNVKWKSYNINLDGKILEIK
ncbi:hypothetical protein [Flavobacterium sp. ASV13]|uniref:hypothetical protein n=1 Tax=Flavobacterium sp. ASV13 TaxID=1506583 RepID=UPI00068D58AD|nr:hypothetical protein [Flavobacterium sp. ASV13]